MTRDGNATRKHVMLHLCSSSPYEAPGFDLLDSYV